MPNHGNPKEAGTHGERREAGHVSIRVWEKLFLA
jgi:hypothetical protein